jgi:hypothetical protein
MKALASILTLSAGLAAFPAFADSLSATNNPVILTGAEACIGPACIGTHHDRDWRYRHHYGYGYDRGGCRDVTIRRDDGSVKHIRRCDY